MIFFRICPPDLTCQSFLNKSSLLPAIHPLFVRGFIAGFIFYSLTAHAVLIDEVQVYDDAINEPGEFGVELHLNATPSGRGTPDYPGEIVPAHGIRSTFELAYASSEHLEWGLYIPLEYTPAGDERFSGFRYRLKYIAQKASAEKPFFYGINFELSHVKTIFEQSQDRLETRPILGWKENGWLYAFNPVIGQNLKPGQRTGGPDFSPSFKIAREVREGFTVGTEYYAELGQFSHFDSYSNQAHTVYLVLDVDRKPFVFNIGIGRGLTAATDHWTIKSIIEIPVD
jgi:hypothetical protein